MARRAFASSRSVASEVEREANGHEAAGHLLTPHASDVDPERFESDPHFLEDRDHVGAAARGRGQEQA